MNRVQVFLVEDDPLVCQVNAQMISSIPQFEVIGTARTIRQAKQQILEIQPELLLIDIYLPDGNGLELLHDLRRERLHFEAMMITAANDTESVKKALEQGVFDYLTKPFERARLEQALERYLTRQHIQNAKNLSQASIDHVLGYTLEPDLPKGIDPNKLEQIKTKLRQNVSSQSAEEIAGSIGISRVTAWRYLEYLCSTNWAALENDQSGTGRPIKRYKRLNISK
jgi:response regulator of citrate/malate metabolism